MYPPIRSPIAQFVPKFFAQSVPSTLMGGVLQPLWQPFVNQTPHPGIWSGRREPLGRQLVSFNHGTVWLGQSRQPGVGWTVKPRESAEAREMDVIHPHSSCVLTSTCLTFPCSKMGLTVPPLELLRGCEMMYVKHLVVAAHPQGGELDWPLVDFASGTWGSATEGRGLAKLY